MIVMLSESFRVDVDKYDHKVEVYEPVLDKKKQPTGKFDWKFVGYYPNMVQAVSSAARYKVMSNNETVKFDEYVNRLNSALKDFTVAAKRELGTV